MGLASYMAEIAAELPALPESKQQLRLLLNCLGTCLMKAKRPVRMKVIYELRPDAAGRYMPDVLKPVPAAAIRWGEFRFDPIAGNLLCAACADKARHLPNLTKARCMRWAPYLFGFRG